MYCWKMAQRIRKGDKMIKLLFTIVCCILLWQSMVNYTIGMTLESIQILLTGCYVCLLYIVYKMEIKEKK